MQLILAIESDPRRSEQLANLVRGRLQVELVLATSAGEGLHALEDRVPDLILTSPLISPFDDGVLDEYLRDLGSAATHVQTLRIPVLSTGRRKSAATRLFSLGRKKTQTSSAAPDGGDAMVFADEIAHYLTRSLEVRTSWAQLAEGTMPRREPEPAPFDYFARGGQPIDDWDAPAAHVEEFRAPIERAPEPVEAAPVFEDSGTPGSILDLRTKVVHEPLKPAVVEPEPEPYVETEPPTYVAPEPTYVKPEPTYVKPERIYVKLEPTYVKPEPTYVRPEPKATHVKPASESTPASTTSGNSAAFEAALAAIRAAWDKPEPTASKPESKPASPAHPAATPSGNAKPVAGWGVVDITKEVDAREDLGDGARASWIRTSASSRRS